LTTATIGEGAAVMTDERHPESTPRPTPRDFDEHLLDLDELAVVERRRAHLPVASAQHDLLAARERELRRRIRAWVERFARPGS
jgi:hypothetical protein